MNQVGDIASGRKIEDKIMKIMEIPIPTKENSIDLEDSHLINKVLKAFRKMQFITNDRYPLGFTKESVPIASYCDQCFIDANGKIFRPIKRLDITADSFSRPTATSCALALA